MLRLAIDKVAAIGLTFLGGVLYAHLGYLTGAPPTVAERATCARVLREVAAHAGERGATLGLESVNRDETYLYNTIADVRKLIEAIGAENVTIHADSYRMNIEEVDFRRGLADAGGSLGAIPCSESDRGCPVRATSTGTKPSSVWSRSATAAR